MITVELGARTLAGTRWALSPVADLVGLLREECARVPGHGAARTAGAASVPWDDPLISLVAELTPVGPGYQPDFLTPKPTAGTPTSRVLADQLDRVAATDPDEVERQVLERYSGGAVPEPVREQLRRRRLAGLAVEGLRRWWQQAGEAAWTRALPRLRADLDERGRQVRRDGLIATLGSLAPEISVEGLALGITLGAWSEHTVLADDELVLVPQAFGIDRVSTQLCRGGDAVLYYPAGRRLSPAPGARAELMGGTRHLVLVALQRPASTKTLSERLGFAAATISYHLDVLRRNGLVTRRRQGLEVLYQQTARGQDLAGDHGAPPRRAPMPTRPAGPGPGSQLPGSGPDQPTRR